MSAITEPDKVHLGRNIKRIREILKVKQQTLATQLGDDWSQKKISQLEDKEAIDDKLLGEVAKALNVPVEAIKEFDENAAINIVGNTFTDFKDSASAINYNCDLNFNPVDKIIELFEALLKSEREKIDLLQKILNHKQ